MKTINPDILGIQEATFGKTKFTNENDNLSDRLPDYELLTFCNAVPSWFIAPYGNAIYVKKDIIENIKASNLKENLCDVSGSKCFMGQQNRIYQEPIFDLFVTHLSVESPNFRIAQLTELKTFIKRKSIIMGDFNLVNFEDYSKSNIVDLNIFWKNMTDYMKSKHKEITDIEYVFIEKNIKMEGFLQIEKQNRIKLFAVGRYKS
jgi:endonuclease/exonuclease/phosphatase family metal-dependent hydrolase